MSDVVETGRSVVALEHDSGDLKKDLINMAVHPSLYVSRANQR